MLWCIDKVTTSQAEVVRHISQCEVVTTNIQLLNWCYRWNLHLGKFVVCHIDILYEFAVIKEETSELIVRDIKHTQVVGILKIQLIQIVMTYIELGYTIDGIEEQ